MRWRSPRAARRHRPRHPDRRDQRRRLRRASSERRCPHRDAHAAALCRSPSRAGARPAVHDDGSIVASGLSSADIGELAAGQELTVHELTPLRFPRRRVHGADELVHPVPLADRRPAGGARRTASSLKGNPMTALSITTSAAARQAPASPPRRWRAGLPQTVRAESTKLVSLRSTRWTLVITSVGTFIVTFLAAHGVLHHPRGWYQGFDPTNQSRPGSPSGHSLWACSASWP